MNDLLKKSIIWWEDNIGKHQHQIHWAEAAALFHDVGKLSKAFLEYRHKWRQMPNGWDADPHDHQFLKKDDLLRKGTYSHIKNWYEKELTIGTENVSIRDVIHGHIDPDDYMQKKHGKPYKSIFLNMLKAADKKDASLDRNNPLFSSDQSDKDKRFFDTDVFGVENTTITPDCLEKLRNSLYMALETNLPDGVNIFSYEERSKFLEITKEHFDWAFSDTTRPNNDTSLWEHAYAVATMLKVIFCHRLIFGEALDSFNKVRFGILGIGWDGLAYMSKGHKIRDIIGRKAIIDKLKEKIKKQTEWQYAIGNLIYEDDNGIYFLIPSIPGDIDLENTDFDKLSEYGCFLQFLKQEIINTSIEVTNGELFPKFHLIPDTRFMTHLVKCITELGKKTKYPYITPPQDLSDKLNEGWGDVRETVCPVCRTSPVKKKEWDICSGCLDIRKNASSFKLNDNLGTPFIKEITLGNKSKDGKIIKAGGRVALIVAKMGLKHWLSGEMIRSLFVSQVKSLENELEELGKTKYFEKQENEFRRKLAYSPSGNLIEKGYDYQRIKHEIDLCYNYGSLSKDDKEYAKHILFLYGRRIGSKDKKSVLNQNVAGTEKEWNDLRNSAIEEDGLSGRYNSFLLYNLLCAKTPTPSSIFDVWRSTEDFFKSLTEIEADTVLGIKNRKRIMADIPKPDNLEVYINAAYEGKIGDFPVEIVWLGKNDMKAWIIGDIKKDQIGSNDTIVLNGKPFGRSEEIKIAGITKVNDEKIYFPLRIITTTPDVFMAIVPASKALDITQKIYREYSKRFGKVIGRLPISIGNIFFSEKMPMFVALDASRRMLDNFDRLHHERIKFRVSKDHDPLDLTIDGLCVSMDEVTIPGNQPYLSIIKWEIPNLLGNNQIDYYHPYFFVDKDSKDYKFRKSYFQTVMGDVIHCNEVQPGDILEVYPNYYDYEFLDSNARRHDIKLDSGLRRKSSVADFKSKPYLLDELPQKIAMLWDALNNDRHLKNLTDTTLRNLQTMWLTKYQEWHVSLDKKREEAYRQWISIVETAFINELPEIDEKHRRLIREMIENGLFFDTLELYLGILKEKRGE